jgi:3-hydroxybutyryl-CoA dehydratase
MKDYTFSDMKVGMIETLVIDLDQKHVDTFMSLSGDMSTVHIDNEYARSRGFRQRLVHGILIASFISQLIGLQLPGKHGVLRTMKCDFQKPCYVPNRLTITGHIEKLVPSLKLVRMRIEVHDATGERIVTANAESVMKC